MNSTLSRFDYIDAARSTAERFVDLTQGIGDADMRLSPSSHWTVADCLGHLSSEPARYIALARGKTSWPSRAAEMSDVYAKQIANMPTRDIRELCGKLLGDLDKLLDLVSHFGARVPMMRVDCGRSVRADSALGILIGELAVHGHDIARRARLRWDLDPSIAPLVARGNHQLLPIWVEDHACRGHHATYDVRLRGCDERYIYEFTDGRLAVNPAEYRTPDVYISVDPVAGLLAGYGRLSPIRAAITGRAIAWGAKPWLAADLLKHFSLVTV
ncbi:MAG: maleylpyruvate isomerase N-terminal domain-containing protein [Gordonia sp. (in: high G+C Gram-positive bacteria)]